MSNECENKKTVIKYIHLILLKKELINKQNTYKISLRKSNQVKLKATNLRFPRRQILNSVI